MTAKEFLKQYEEADRRAQRCRAEYEREHELIDSVKSTLDTDGMPRGSGITRITEDRALRLSEKAIAWKMAELDAIEKRQEVFELIHSISGVEGEILTERYVNLRKWEAVCIAVHLSWYAVHQHHRKALAIVESKLKSQHRKNI